MEDAAVTSEAVRRLNDTDQFVILLNVCAAIFGSVIYCLLTMRQRQSNEQRSSYFAGPFVSLAEASQSWKVYRQWTNKTERDMHVCNFCGFAIKASPSEANSARQELYQEDAKANPTVKEGHGSSGTLQACWLIEYKLAAMPAAVFPAADEVQVKALACNDKWCIAVFLLVISGMSGLTWWATAKEGANIERLIHPVDYSGQVCGYSPGVEDKPYLYVCGKANAGFQGDYPNQLDFQSKTCVAECPQNGGEVACIGRPLVTPYAVDSQNHNGINVHGVQVLKTVTWRISQAVTYQKSYPTEAFRHMMCAPAWDAPNDLRDQIIFGRASPLSKAGETLGSLLTAWPVLLSVFVIATILSIVFLLLMTWYAGPVLFVSMVLADALVFILGIFFALGLFFDPFNTTGWYQQWNPIERTIYGEWARVLSFFLGLILLGMGVLLLRTLYHSAERIDEPVGLIHASMEFIFEPSGSSIKFLLLVPFLSSVTTVGMVGFAILCFMLVVTAGPVDSRGIVVNGDHYPSMYKAIQKPWNGIGWDISMLLFVAGFIWLIELMIAVQQYTVTHVVCNWFFQDIKNLPSKEKEKEKNVEKAKQESHAHELMHPQQFPCHDGLSLQRWLE
eukprot:symbB.v1.2.015611.t1/scaffold1172.1/size134038/8